MKNAVLIYVMMYASIASGFIPLVCSIARYRHLKSFLWVLFGYSVLSLITETVATILAHFHHPTYLVHHCFTVLECSTFVYLYLNKFDAPTSKKIILLLYLLFLLIAFIVLIVQSGFNRSDIVVSSLSAVFLVCLAAAYFYNAANDETHKRMTDDYFFWISTAVMLYFCMAFLFFLFTDYIEKRGIRTVYYSLQWVVNIMYNVLLGVGIWKVKQA